MNKKYLKNTINNSINFNYVFYVNYINFYISNLIKNVSYTFLNFYLIIL